MCPHPEEETSLRFHNFEIAVSSRISKQVLRRSQIGIRQGYTVVTVII